MANQIQSLTNFANQITQLQLLDGSIAVMELIYQGATERWVMNVSYGDVVINGINLCCYPNVLRQWKETLPFGLACVTADQTDPVDINDFATGRAQIYLLDQTDIVEIDSSVFAGAA